VCVLVNIYTNYIVLNKKEKINKTSFYLFIFSIIFCYFIILWRIFLSLGGTLTFCSSLRVDIDAIGSLCGYWQLNGSLRGYRDHTTIDHTWSYYDPSH